MSSWKMQGRLKLTTLLLLVHVCIAHSFSIVYNNGKEGRKLFGGYRISPKTCTVGVRKGICMFNYECTLHKGAMLGSCMDGFLFGTCCNLPANANVVDNNMFVPPSSQQQQQYDYDLTEDEEHNSFNTNLYQSSTFDDTFSKPPSLRPPNSNHAPPTPKPAVTEKHPLLHVDAHPETDTILLHQNGSAVEDFSNPEDYYKPLRDTITPDPDADAEFSTFSHVGGGDLISTIEAISAESMASDATKQESSTESASTESMDSSSSSSEASSVELKSTTVAERVSSAAYPATNKLETRPLELVTTQWPWTKTSSTQAYTKPTTVDFTPTYYSSRWPTNQPRPTIGFRPRPTPPTVIRDPVAEMVLVPTLLTGNQGGASSLPPNSESINQLLSMLDVNSPMEIATPAMDVEQKLTSRKPGIVTWASLHSQSTTNRRPTPPSVYYSTPAKRPASPSTTTLSVAGPSFDVVNTRPGPPPTVIVLGPLTSDFTTTRPTTNRKPVIFSSTNKVKVTAKPGAFKPSSSGKPGIIITRRTTTTPATPSKPSTTPSNIAIKRPSTVVTKRPTTTGTRRPVTIADSEEEEAVTSIADLSNFPPVRNPSLNTSRPVENGVITEIVTPPPIVHVAVTEEEPIEANTPIFIEDDKLNDKMDIFVNKIVESLQGNFQDLEDVLYKRKNVSELAGPTSKRPIAQGDDVVTKPTPTKRPTRTTTPKAKPVVATTAKPTRPRPSKKPSTTKPFRVSTEVPITTKKPKRTTTTPAPTTTPTPPPTTKRPRPTTTKKPKRTTTPEYEDDEIIETTTKVTRKTTTESEEIIDEEDEEDVTTLRPADYRRDCGVRPLMKKKGRIVGGKGSTFGEWPWQVLVRESTWLGLFTKNKCGGVLITNKFVMTAAHCQPGFLANLVAVFGEYDISGELESKRSVTKNVRRVIVHRHYDAATFANDLALLELDSAVAFDTHIVPICMPHDEEDFTGRMATVSGWGRLKYGGGVPSVLQEVHVPIIENSVCQEMFQTAGHSKKILDSFLCAGYANGQKDSCEGDSGGPLMLERDDGRWTLAGTVSHGIKCAAPYLPGVYMRTTYYKPWLKTITGVDG